MALLGVLFISCNSHPNGNKLVMKISFAVVRAIFFIVVLVISIAPMLVQAHSAATPAPRYGDYWIDRQRQINERIRQGSVDVLFVGDSIMRGWEGVVVGPDGRIHHEPGQAVWDKYYAKRNAVNEGINGDKTQNILWRLDHGNADGISPKLSIVMVGTNNYRSYTAEAISDGIVAVVKKLLDKFPKSKVLLIAIFPRGAEPSQVRVKLARASELAAARIADGDKVHYMDIASKFLADDGTLSPDIMPDGLHPNEKGYRIWAEAIEPKVRELLGE